MARTLKQYYRAILVKLGLFDEGAFRLVINRIYPDDTFIVSYPKSGNTWMRFLLANLLHPEQEINFRNIDDFVPDVYSARKQVNKLQRPRFIKAHDAWFHYFPKTIYIVRDYRDVLVSYYHYQQALGVFTGTLEEYISHVNTHHPFGNWCEHVQAALTFQEKNPEKIIIIRYEDLLNDTVQVLQQLTAWLNIAPAASPESVAERCRFENLRKLEETAGSAFMDKSNGEHFFREGKAGGWSKLFKPHMLKKLYEDAGVQAMLAHFKYTHPGEGFIFKTPPTV